MSGSRRAAGRRLGLDLGARALRRLPPPVALGALAWIARAWATWSARGGGPALPRGVAGFPGAAATLLGEPLSPAQARRLLEARLRFLLVRHLVGYARGAPSALAGSRLVAHIDVRGAEHLDAALARGRGLIAVSTHFGFPQLLGPVLTARGLASVSARALADAEHQVTVSGDVWARAGALQHMRGALRKDLVGVLLVDGAQGAAVRLPFLSVEIAVGLGAMHLARVAGAALLPFFGMLDHARGFGLEFSPAIEVPPRASHDVVLDVVRQLLDRYAGVARRHPSHLPVRLVGGLAASPAPEVAAGTGAPSLPAPTPPRPVTGGA